VNLKSGPPLSAVNVWPSSSKAMVRILAGPGARRYCAALQDAGNS
jgi:hypothetical protein